MSRDKKKEVIKGERISEEIEKAFKEGKDDTVNEIEMK
jgi:hypothetical protein